MSTNTRRMRLFAGAFLIFFAVAAIAGGGLTQLPRAYGPFTLRMPASEFTVLTGVKPAPCAVCIEGELFASLDGRELRHLIPSFPLEDGMDFFFYENKLYHFTLGADVKDLFLAQQAYSERFGGPGRIFEQDNGTAMMKWEDTGTVITANYRTMDEEVFALNYFDWDLKTERDWRESLNNDQGLAGQ